MEMKENHSTEKHSGGGKDALKGSTLHLEGVRGIDQSAWIPEASCCPCSHHAVTHDVTQTALFTALSPEDVCEWRTWV